MKKVRVAEVDYVEFYFLIFLGSCFKIRLSFTTKEDEDDTYRVSGDIKVVSQHV